MTTNEEPSPEFVAIAAMAADIGFADGSTSIAHKKALLTMEAPEIEGARVDKVDAGGVESYWIVADGSSTERAVIHFHGGAYITGGLGSHGAFAAALSAEVDCAVLLVDYRLAPESPFPAAFDDAKAAYEWLIGEGKGIDPAKVVVGGDSAGGGLAAALLVALRDDHKPLPSGSFLLSPWADLAHSGESHKLFNGSDPLISTETLEQCAQAYLNGVVDNKDVRVSPIYADLSGLPPILIHVAEGEVLRDDAVRLAANANESGTSAEIHIAPNMIHVWHLFAGLAPESTRAFEAVAKWIKARHEGNPS